jgi:hypothetical protein
MTGSVQELKRGVVTIAIGDEIYREMAYALARSFRLHNDIAEIAFVLVTDRVGEVPSDLGWVRKRSPVSDPADCFCHKLYLDRYCDGYDAVLFIDADSLIFGRLDIVFEKLSGRSVAVIGGTMCDGEWCGDVRFRCDQLGLASVPAFNGSVYAIEPGDEATQVFSDARALRSRYDQLGIALLAGHHNEEPLISLALAKHGMVANYDDSSIKVDAMCASGRVHCGLRSGCVVAAVNPRNWLPARQGPVRPVIFHFNATFAERWPYTSLSRALRFHYQCYMPWVFASGVAFAASIPERMQDFLRDSLRPFHRRLFGVRPVRQGERARALRR